MSTFQTEQLHNGMQLSTEELECLSALVYDTDPFIYPAMFYSRQQALRVLPQVFRRGTDTVFNLNNCFIIRLQGEIAGLLLWHKGSVMWSIESLFMALKSDMEPIASGLVLAKTEYFDSYQAKTDDLINIINVCISKDMRGKGIGNVLLNSFIQNHSECDMELFVLCDNFPAISLYKANGFAPEGKQHGFSLDIHKPECIMFTRKSNLRRLLI